MTIDGHGQQLSREDWRDLPPLTRAVVELTDVVLTVAVDGVTGSVEYGVRMTGKAETLLDESIGLVRDARPLVHALKKAVDDGVIDDLQRVLHLTETTITQVSAVANRLDAAAAQIGNLVPDLDLTAKKLLPVAETLPATQADIHQALDAVLRVEALITGTFAALPGARLVKGIAGLGRVREEPSGEE